MMHFEIMYGENYAPYEFCKDKFMVGGVSELSQKIQNDYGNRNIMYIKRDIDKEAKENGSFE